MPPSTGFRRGWMNFLSLSLWEKAAAGDAPASHPPGMASVALAKAPALRRLRRLRGLVNIPRFPSKHVRNNRSRHVSDGHEARARPAWSDDGDRLAQRRVIIH